jgi:hypothetical protein
VDQLPPPPLLFIHRSLGLYTGPGGIARCTRPAATPTTLGTYVSGLRRHRIVRFNANA